MKKKHPLKLITPIGEEVIIEKKPHTRLYINAYSGNIFYSRREIEKKGKHPNSVKFGKWVIMRIDTWYSKNKKYKVPVWYMIKI